MNAGLHPDLFKDLKEVLSKSDYFASDTILRTLFMDPRILLWRDSLQETTSKSTRVDLLIDTLRNKADHQGTNALHLFLEVLKERTAPEDAQYGKLERLIRRHTSRLTVSGVAHKHITFINREVEKLDIQSDMSKIGYRFIYAPQGYGKTTFLNEIIQYYLHEQWGCAHVQISREYTPKLCSLIEDIVWTFGEEIKCEEESTPEEIGRELSSCILRCRVQDADEQLGNTNGRGMVLIIDDADTLDKETLEGLAVVISKTFEHLHEVNFFTHRSHRLRLFLSGRSAQLIRSIFGPYPIRLKETRLSPYAYEYVYETVMCYMFSAGQSLGEKKVTEIASQLSYHGGGHPGCLASLLSHLAYKKFAGYSYYLSQEEQIREPVYTVLKNFRATLLNQDLFPLLETLSIFRLLDRPLLQHLSDHQIISDDKRIIQLEKQLFGHYFFPEKKGLFRDGTIQQLLLIRFRNERAEEFAEACQVGLDFYQKQLSEHSATPTLYAREYLYLYIHQACHVNGLHSEALKEGFAQQLDFVATCFLDTWPLDSAQKFIHELTEELKEDWELEFLANYFISPHAYSKEHFRNIVDDFKRRHLEDLYI
jgi:hypothetical protein